MDGVPDSDTEIMDDAAKMAETPDPAAAAAAAAAGASAGPLSWHVIAVLLIVLVITIIVSRVFLFQEKKRDEVEEVDEIFDASLTKEVVREIVQAKHAEMVMMGEEDEIDLEDLGLTSWPDMPNVTLIAIMEELLEAGSRAVDAEDFSGAVLAFSEALELEENARLPELALQDTADLVQSVVFRLLLHRSGAHEALENAEEAARDAEAAKRMHSEHFPSAEAVDGEPAVSVPSASDAEDDVEEQD